MKKALGFIGVLSFIAAASAALGQVGGFDANGDPYFGMRAALPTGTNTIGGVNLSQYTPASGRLPVDGSGVTQPVSGTVAVSTLPALVAGTANIGDVDVLSFPDNEPVNVAQINGVAPLMGNGASGTGAPRVTIASDSTGILAGVTTVTTLTNLTNLPNEGKQTAANSISVTTDSDTAPCSDASQVNSVAISTATSGNVQLVAISGSTIVYVCGYNVIAGGTVNVQFINGTGTACATGETDETGAYPLTAQAGVSVPNGGHVQFKTDAGDALCIELSAAIQVDGLVTFVQR